MVSQLWLGEIDGERLVVGVRGLVWWVGGKGGSMGVIVMGELGDGLRSAVSLRNGRK